MAANTQSIHGLTPNTGQVRLSTANTTRDLSVTTNAGLLITAGAFGSRLERVTFTHTAADQTTASVNIVARVYVTDAAIANPRLIKEIAISAVTPSSTAIGAQGIANFIGGFLLKSTQLIYVAISVTSGWDVVGEAFDY